MILESEVRQHWLIAGFFVLKNHTSDPCVWRLASYQQGKESLLVADLDSVCTQEVFLVL